MLPYMYNVALKKENKPKISFNKHTHKMTYAFMVEFFFWGKGKYCSYVNMYNFTWTIYVYIDSYCVLYENIVCLNFSSSQNGCSSHNMAMGSVILSHIHTYISG